MTITNMYVTPPEILYHLNHLQQDFSYSLSISTPNLSSFPHLWLCFTAFTMPMKFSCEPPKLQTMHFNTRLANLHYKFVQLSLQAHLQ